MNKIDQYMMQKKNSKMNEYKLFIDTKKSYIVNLMNEEKNSTYMYASRTTHYIFITTSIIFS